MVDVTGVLERELRITPDPDKLAVLELSIEDLENALVQNNVEPGSMTVRDGYYEYNIKFSTLLRTEEDVRNILLRKGERIVRLGDFCDVAVVPVDSKGIAMCNGKQAVVLAVILAREFAVSGLRMVAAGAKDGKVIAANMWGKVKTVLQMLSIIFYYFAAALGGPTDPLAVGMIGSALCWLVAVVTAISGIKYLVDNRHFINTAK